MKTELGMKGDGFINRLSNRVGSGARSLLSSAGKAGGPASFEALEPRVLLSGDHAGIDEVFPTLTRQPTEIVLPDVDMDGNADSRVFATGQIGDVPDDTGDFFRFTALSDGFVSVLAQAITSTTTVDTQVEVYLPDGTELTETTGGVNNGQLARGFSQDGWYGFVAEAGQEYYVRVIGQNADDLDAGAGDGFYSLWINASVSDVPAGGSAGTFRTGSDTGDEQTITTTLEDRLYTFTTGSEASLGYVMAGDIVFGDQDEGYIAQGAGVTPRDLFDARVEVFDADGALVAANSDGGYLYDAFSLVRFEANSTYYVRVRSDAPTTINITDPQESTPTMTVLDDVSVGEFELRIQTLATDIAIDPDTRLTEFDRSSSGLTVDDRSPTARDNAGLLRDQHSAQIFAFDSLTAGQTFVNFFTYGDVLLFGQPVGLTLQVLDTSIAVFDDSDSLVAFQTNDTLIQGDGWDRPGVVFAAEGNERYYVLVDAFDGTFQATGDTPTDVEVAQFDYRLAIESSAVLDFSDTDQIVDDHIDLTGTDEDDDGEFESIDARVADFATPLVWSGLDSAYGFSDDTFLTDDLNMNMVPDGFFFPGLLDPDLIGNPDFQVDDHSRVVRAFGNGRLDASNDTDVFMFVPQVDMLGSFEGAVDPLSGLDGEGGEPGQTWAENGRPSSRLTVNVFFEAEWFAFGGSAVQIYDSNFNLINEEFATPISSVLNGSQPAGSLSIPSGVQSPSLLPPGVTDGDNVDATMPEAVVTLDNQYWAGEAYYLVISAPLGASRYNVVVQADGFDRTPGGYAVDVDTPEEGAFGAAQELVFNNNGIATNNLNPNNDTGDVRDFAVVTADAFDDDGNPDPMAAGYFDQITNTGQLGLIHDYRDTDIYRFTAPNTGSAEILLSTTQLQDLFTEEFIANAILPGLVVDQNTLTKVYNSPLDAAMRVYDSSGEQVAYIDDFLGYSSEGTTLSFGQPNIGNIQLQRKDPRLVIEVEQGEQYFVVVESSQRWEANAGAANFADRDAPEPEEGDIDWRRATGSYQLIINATPNQGIVDDHVDGDFFRNFRATVIPIDSDPSSPTNGQGSISGVIERTDDTDVFEFLAPTSGVVRFTLDPAGTLSLSATVRDGGSQVIPIFPNSAINGELLTTEFGVTQGERYLIEVSTLAGTGTYDITLSGLAVEDDLVGVGRYAQAAELTFGAFDRSIEATAEIEQAGDSEIFVFEAPEADELTIRVSADSSPGFSGTLEVYELTDDPSAVFTSKNHYLVSYDLNPDGDSIVSRTINTQAGRTYYVVVAGSDPFSTTGRYLLELSYNPEDDHADIGELATASFINVVPTEGTGSITGVLEQSSDSDLFVFGAPAAGPVDVTLAWDAAPPAAFTLQLYDIDGNIVDINSDGMGDSSDVVTGTGGTLALPSVVASPGDIFFVSVTGPNATEIGYTLTVNTGLLDDHANEGDLAGATQITLSPVTGDGSRTGILEVDDDTDLFTFSVADGADVDVTVASSDITTPVVRIFDASGALVSSTAITGGVTFTNTTGSDAVFYASVGSTFPGFQSGAYTINVDGPPAPPSPNDDHADEGDLANATVITPNAVTGNANVAGVMNAALDSDLFRYDTVARGTAFVQVVTSDMSSPDFAIRVFDASGMELTALADSAGLPGARGVTAATRIDVAGSGETYYLLVESTDNVDVGDYTLRVDGVAATSVVFYPEGFANASIREFVSIANPNGEAVDYTIRVYYADAGLGSAVVASGTLAAGARGGATLSFGGDIDGDGNADYAPGIVPNEAYAIAVESTLRLAAGLSHYDNGILDAASDPLGLDRSSGAIGEAFTDRTSTTWAFADVTRNPGVVEEYLVYFNPNSFDVDLTVTAFTSAGEISLSTITLGANRRGGIEIHNTSAFPLGTFAIELTAEASDPMNEDSNLGVVASVSRYNVLNQTAYGYLGTPDGGSTFNVVTSLTEGPSIDSEINLFNAGDSATTVTITGTYLSDQSLPTLTRIVTLAAGQRFTLTGQSLAFVSNVPIGLEISSTSAIAVSSVETQRGDATAVAGFTEAGDSFFFGDAFMNPEQAGSLYSEALTLYNPSGSDANVTVTFLFADGTAARVYTGGSVVVDAGGFLRLQLEDLTEVVNNRPKLNFFSIQVDSDTGIVAQLSHFDGFLGGGWSSGGAALGLTNSIA